MRLAVARVLSELPAAYQTNCSDLVEAAMAQLREDKDADVRLAMNKDGNTVVVTDKTDLADPVDTVDTEEQSDNED